MGNLQESKAVNRDSGGVYILRDGVKFYFQDAEKRTTKSDDMLCWAATASNMLYNSNWGITVKTKREDDVFNVFRSNFKFSSQYGGLIDAGVKWYIVGKYDCAGMNGADQLKNNKYKGLYRDANISKYLSSVNGSISGMTQAITTLAQGGTVSLGVGFLRVPGGIWNAGADTRSPAMKSQSIVNTR